MASQQTVTIDADTKPILLVLELLNRSLQTRVSPFDVGDLDFELVRIEQVTNPANANEILVTFYPSDALLNFAAAALARDLDLEFIKQLFHCYASISFESSFASSTKKNGADRS